MKQQKKMQEEALREQKRCEKEDAEAKKRHKRQEEETLKEQKRREKEEAETRKQHKITFPIAPNPEAYLSMTELCDVVVLESRSLRAR